MIDMLTKARNAPKKPKLKVSQVYAEVAERAGCPKNLVEKVLAAYREIVKQCIKNKVMVPFGEIGTFSFKVIPPRDIFEWTGYYRRTDVENDEQERVIFYYPCYDGYVKPIFKLSKSFTKEVKDVTLIPYGEVPSEPGFEATTQEPLRRVNYIDYLKEYYPDKYKDLVIHGRTVSGGTLPDSILPLEEDYSEYDLLLEESGEE